MNHYSVESQNRSCRNTTNIVRAWYASVPKFKSVPHRKYLQRKQTFAAHLHRRFISPIYEYWNNSKNKSRHKYLYASRLFYTTITKRMKSMHFGMRKDLDERWDSRCLFLGLAGYMSRWMLKCAEINMRRTASSRAVKPVRRTLIPQLNWNLWVSQSGGSLGRLFFLLASAILLRR